MHEAVELRREKREVEIKKQESKMRLETPCSMVCREDICCWQLFDLFLCYLKEFQLSFL